MDPNLRNELLLVLANENIDDETQIRILNTCSKFVNNIKYMEKVKEKFSEIFVDEIFLVLLPKLFSVIIEVNQSVDNLKEINEKYMKFVIYAVIYSYLDQNKSEVLSKVEGDLRVAFVHISELLLLNPKNIKVISTKCFSSCWSCMHDHTKIHL